MEMLTIEIIFMVVFGFIASFLMTFGITLLNSVLKGSSKVDISLPMALIFISFLLFYAVFDIWKARSIESTFYYSKPDFINKLPDKVLLVYGEQSILSTETALRAQPEKIFILVEKVNRANGTEYYNIKAVHEIDLDPKIKRIEKEK